MEKHSQKKFGLYQQNEGGVCVFGTVYFSAFWIMQIFLLAK